jgi:hypothetical protein
MAAVCRMGRFNTSIKKEKFMRRQSWIACALVFGATVWLAGQAISDEKDAPKDAKKSSHEMDKDAMMADWMQLGQPGEHHKHLNPLAGNWSYVLRWTMDPSEPMQETNGTSENKWVFGGRFLKLKVTGESSEDGNTFEGLGFYGYDNLKKQYVSIWLDNHSTGIWMAMGSCDPSGTVFTYVGGETDPRTGKQKQVRSVLRILGDDRYVFEMHEPGPDGKEFKMMEITYMRKK